MGQFNYLTSPDPFQEYWTKYPEGYTIYEALLDYINQVNPVIENINQMNSVLDNFILTFSVNLQDTVRTILNGWILDGTIEIIISEALQTQINLRGLIPSGLVSGGLVDNSVVLQNAINTAQVSNQVIYIPSGVYLVNTPLTTTHPIYMVGLNEVIFKGDLNDFININHDITLNHLKFENFNRVVHVLAEASEDIQISITHCSIESCNHLFYSYPLAVYKQYHTLKVIYCTFKTTDIPVFVRRSQFNQVLIHHNYSDGMVRGFCRLGGASEESNAFILNINIHDNTVLNVFQPVEGDDVEAQAFLIYGDYFNVSHNHIRNINKAGTNPADCEAIYARGRYGIISHNIIVDGGKREGAILVKGDGQHVLIENNIIRFTPPMPTSNSAPYGITTTRSNITIKGNMIENAGRGIHLYETINECIIQDNIFNSCYFAINVAGVGNRLIIENNKAYTPYSFVVPNSSEVIIEEVIINNNTVSQQKGYFYRGLASVKDLMIYDNTIITSNIIGAQCISLETGRSGNASEVTIKNNVIKGFINELLTEGRAIFTSASTALGRVIIADNIIDNVMRGISLTGNITTLLVFNNQITNFGHSAMASSATIGALSVKDNVGIQSEVQGIATLLSGNTTVTVPISPALNSMLTNRVAWITLQSAPSGATHWWVTSLTANQLVINVGSAPSANLSFAYRVVAY
jgi:parallel beta-helix repeat protein